MLSVIEAIGVLCHNWQMGRTQHLKDDPAALSDAELEAIRQGREDIASGRFIDHKAMTDWLKSWGDDPKRPLPRPWLSAKEK
ncbi:MAG: hypothetical protein HZA67_09025 [Rhodospirillales bacterium]|jgi:hypothetical protein|nr:hypothetical protein [Rhodospirillales bacterium]MDK9722547.1 hypothetical protein [Rhodospirillales bacterium]